MGRFTRRWILPVFYLTDHWISRVGLWLVISAVVLWIFLTGASEASGYLGILQFVALPVLFFAGLGLVPLGIALQRRREAPDHHLHLPERVEWGNRRVQRLLVFLAVATCLWLKTWRAILTFAPASGKKPATWFTTSSIATNPL